MKQQHEDSSGKRPFGCDQFPVEAAVLKLAMAEPSGAVPSLTAIHRHTALRGSKREFDVDMRTSDHGPRTWLQVAPKAM